MVSILEVSTMIYISDVLEFFIADSSLSF